jgi:sulfatase modifying factor 1
MQHARKSPAPKAVTQVSTIAVIAPLCASVALGCAGASAPAPGQVMLVLETDGGDGTPLDFARVAVVVTDARASGQLVRSYDLTPARLPGTVALVAEAARGATTQVEVFATDARGALRVYQAARVTIPTEGARMLRVKLEAACDGVVPKVPCPGGAATCADAPRLACQSGRACLAGRCVPVQEYGPRDLPAYDASRVEACEPETEAAICARRAIACGSFVLPDTCGTPRVVRCGACDGQLSGTTAKLAGPGLDDCGPLAAEPCGQSLLVAGGAFRRGKLTPAQSSVSDFRLDTYEVTVGRFRRFVDAWLGGWRPAPSSGTHAHLNGGAGLAERSGSGFERGWDPAWSAYVGAPKVDATVPTGPGAATKREWDANLSCWSAFATWTSAPGENEAQPQNCLSWYDLHAFCIWDGGFLPSETEWEYAAAGGAEQRTYPWGNTAPGQDTSLAVYGCLLNGNDRQVCAGTRSIAEVGSAPAGAGRWGQLDLAGNLWEWTLDWNQGAFGDACRDCVESSPSDERVVRGGSFDSAAGDLPVAARGGVYGLPASRAFSKGGRCARRP